MASHPVKPVLVLVMAMVGGAISGLFFGAAFLQAQTVSPLTIQPDTGRVGIGTMTPGAKLHVSGGDIRWANNSQLGVDQGGSIELGGDGPTAGTGIPYIDFHYSSLAQDFNVRIINDANGRLSLIAPIFYASGNVGVGTITPTQKVDVAGNMNVSGAYYRGGVAGFTGVVGTACGLDLDIRGGIIVAATPGVCSFDPGAGGGS